MKTKFNHEGGLIKWIVLIVIGLIILGYYGFDLRKAVEAPTTQNNLTYVQQIVSNIWHNFLEKPATYLWKDIFLKLIWSSAIENLNRLKNSQPSTVDQMAPKLNTAPTAR